MEIFFQILKWLWILIVVFTTPIFIWLLISQIAGFLPKKPLKIIDNKIHRFGVVICARNEETVIAQLLESLKNQDYDQEKYKCIVVADNCTDNTAAVAKEHGAIVFERFDKRKQAKGFALNFCMKKINLEYHNEFDAICVFDADNLVSANFLTEMNKALCTSGDIAIGYRSSKNIHDSWVSEVNSIYWLILARTYHLSRHNMGLSSIVSGTGFGFKLSVLDDKGWKTRTITEDVEFSIQKITEGAKVVFAKNAVFFDEQPVTFISSFQQRIRWMTGGFQCLNLYLPTVCKSIKAGNFKILDLLWYLLLVPVAGLSIPLTFGTVVWVILKPETYFVSIPIFLGFMGISWLYSVVISFATLKLEKREIRPMLRGIMLFPIFVYSLMLAALIAMVHPTKDWKPIPHNNVNTIDEMKAE